MLAGVWVQKKIMIIIISFLPRCEKSSSLRAMLRRRKRENSRENGEFFQIENFSSRKSSKKQRFTRFPGKFPILAVLIYPHGLLQGLLQGIPNGLTVSIESWGWEGQKFKSSLRRETIISFRDIISDHLLWSIFLYRMHIFAR